MVVVGISDLAADHDIDDACDYGGGRFGEGFRVPFRRRMR
jgi:hypothetical protein